MVHVCIGVVLNVVNENRLEMFSYRLTYHLVYGLSVCGLCTLNLQPCHKFHIFLPHANVNKCYNSIYDIYVFRKCVIMFDCLNFHLWKYDRHPSLIFIKSAHLSFLTFFMN